MQCLLLTYLSILTHPHISYIASHYTLKPARLVRTEGTICRAPPRVITPGASFSGIGGGATHLLFYDFVLTRTVPSVVLLPGNEEESNLKLYVYSINRSFREQITYFNVFIDGTILVAHYHLHLLNSNNISVFAVRDL